MSAPEYLLRVRANSQVKIVCVEGDADMEPEELHTCFGHTLLVDARGDLHFENHEGEDEVGAARAAAALREEPLPPCAHVLALWERLQGDGANLHLGTDGLACSPPLSTQELRDVVRRQIDNPLRPCPVDIKRQVPFLAFLLLHYRAAKLELFPL